MNPTALILESVYANAPLEFLIDKSSAPIDKHKHQHKHDSE